MDNVAVENERIGTYSRHSCRKTHRVHRAMAKCLWPYADVTGDGRYVLMSWCHRLQASLFDDVKDAWTRKQQLDNDSCGPRCRMNHSVIRLELPNDHG